MLAKTPHITDIFTLFAQFFTSVSGAYNNFKTASKEKFEELKKILADKYGKGEIPDRLKSWINALMGKDRVLSWVSTNPTNEIAAIVLSAKGSATKSGNVTLSYEFRGWTEHAEEREKKEASQF